MLKKNDEITVKIDSVSSDGSGVARHDGMAVFVPAAIAGETVVAHVIKVNKTYAVAKLMSVTEQSPARIEPLCPVFGKCGGCTYMHMTYENELQVKKQRVTDAVRRIGGLDNEICDVLGGTPERYRNKAMYPVGAGLRFGFYGKASHNLVECGDCSLMPSEFRIIADAVCLWARENRVTEYDERTGKGLLRNIFIRKGKSIGVCLVINGDSVPNKKGLVEALKSSAENITSLTLNINLERGNTLLGNKTITIYGDGFITDTLFGLEFRIAPQAFYQVNKCQAERLYSLAASLAGLSGRETLLDLYCGTGIIGLTMAKNVGRLIGVEIVPQAVENARENAAMNGITNAEFICGDAAAAAKKLAEEKNVPDVIILDPPRKGCDSSLIETVSAISPQKIVYVSCDPATLARDLSIFAECGYASGAVHPVDMFPRTAHVECVVLLSRKLM